METTTIDTILRKRAAAKLWQELDEAFKAAFNQLRGEGEIFAGLYNKEGHTNPENTNEYPGYHGQIGCSDALRRIKQAIFDRGITNYESKEIFAFTSKVDSLAAEIQELKEGL